MNSSLAHACLCVTVALDDLRGNPSEHEIEELKRVVDRWSETIREVMQKKTFTFYRLDGLQVTLTLPEIMAPSNYGPPALVNARLVKLLNNKAVYLMQKEQLRVIVPYAEADDGLYHLEEPYLED